MSSTKTSKNVYAKPGGVLVEDRRPPGLIASAITVANDRYRGSSCEICGAAFIERDAILVLPVRGTSFEALAHRSCVYRLLSAADRLDEVEQEFVRIQDDAKHGKFAGWIWARVTDDDTT